MNFNNTQFTAGPSMQNKTKEPMFYKHNRQPPRSFSENCIVGENHENSPYQLWNESYRHSSFEFENYTDAAVKKLSPTEQSMQNLKHFSQSILEIPKLREKFLESGNINDEVMKKQIIVKGNDSEPGYNTAIFPSFDSLDEISEALKQKEHLIYMKQVESFESIKSCRQDQASGADNILLSRDPRTQNILVGRRNLEENPPPPPYTSDAYAYQGYRSNQAPVYVYEQFEPRNSNRAPPYQWDDPMITMNLFDDAYIRKHFVKKVYTILGLQLFVTFGLVAVTVFHKPTKLFFIRNYFLLYILSTLLMFFIFIIFCCFQASRRIVPLNFILLIIFTIAMSIIAATISSMYSTYAVMLTFGITAVLCLILTFIACLPCFDITGYYIYLYVAALILFFYGIIAIFISVMTKLRIAYTIYAALATILFSMYLIFDTQQLLAGKRIQLSPEEYILGAISLYVDIIYIFLYILTLCGNR